MSKSIQAIKNFALITLLATFSVACAQIDTSRQENPIEVCFNLSSRNLTADIRQLSCFSSSCTREVEKSGEIQISDFAIRIKAKHITVDPIEPKEHTCTADCMTLDNVTFYLGTVTAGTYAVWIGDKKVGELVVPPPEPQGRPFCFNTLPLPTPTPKYAGPAITLTPPATRMPSPLQPFVSPLAAP